MKVTPKMAMSVLRHEGIVPQAYKDSVGVLTWGVGVTNASGHAVQRYVKNPQPMPHVLRIFVWLLETKYMPAVRKAFAGHELTEAQWASALSFHYNTGGIRRASWVKDFKAGDMAGARRGFMGWSKPVAIIPRRRLERDIFFGDKPFDPGKTATVYRSVSQNSMQPIQPAKVNVWDDLLDAMNVVDVSPKDKPPLDVPSKPATIPTTKKPTFWEFLLALFRR
jgi:GH24 family phage-related lysozyme (muramidase)